MTPTEKAVDNLGNPPPGEFVTALGRILPRLKIYWSPWTAAKGDVNGDMVWPPLPVPPIVRATTLDDEVVWRPQAGKGSGTWRRVPPERVTPGRWTLWEDVEGQPFKLFDVCDLDSGPLPLDSRVVNLLATCYDAWPELKRQIENQFEEVEVSPGVHTANGILPGPPVPKVVYRNRAQQAWRKEAEDAARDVLGSIYNEEHAFYQSGATPKPRGERHPAGFVVNDKRHRHIRP